MNIDSPVKCGDTVRFEHVMTGRNMHSHAIASHIANGWEEVSAFGQNGHGDAGDDFKLMCEYKQEGQVIKG